MELWSCGGNGVVWGGVTVMWDIGTVDFGVLVLWGNGLVK